MESTFKLGVPSKPVAIYFTPSGPSPQLLINKTYKKLAWLKNPSNALAPNGLTAL
jgi:hypothetical protein